MSNKYGAQRVQVDGIWMASKAEARRYGQLKLLLAAGEICDLECHPRFDLWVNDVKVGVYVADFTYVVIDGWKRITEDVKGGKATATPLFKLKAKLMKAIHGIEVVIVEA